MKTLIAIATLAALAACNGPLPAGDAPGGDLSEHRPSPDKRKSPAQGE